MAKKTTVLVVIPIYNEQEELEANTLKLHSFLKKHCSAYAWRIMIADNASTDRSLEIAQKIEKKHSETAVMHLDQKGRGRAVKKAWSEGTWDIVAYMDIDLSTELASFPRVLKALDTGYDIAIGSRLLPGARVVGRTMKREIISRSYNILIKILFGVHFSDAQCGFKAMKGSVARQLLPHIEDTAWFFDSEMLILGEKLGLKIYEDPVVWVDNPGSTVRILGTVKGDLKGLWRLFTTRPWRRIQHL